MRRSVFFIQSFDKQGFHAGTPPPFSLPSALGGPGPLNPGAAPGGYAPAPFLHILPHQQPHSQLLHHHLAQDGQVRFSGVHWCKYERRRCLHNCALACSGRSGPARSVQQSAAEEPSQQVKLRQLPLLGQLRRHHGRVCACVQRGSTHRTTSAYDWPNHTGTKYFTTQAKTHTTNPSPLLCISPFSNLWLLYVKYIYVCIYTVYMYW